MKIYLAGPMRGYPRYNFDAFATYSERLREQGYEVVSPAELDLARGFDPDLPLDQQSGDFGLKEVMLADVAALAECDAVALMPGWRQSTGARAEVAFAEAIDIPVYEIEVTFS